MSEEIEKKIAEILCCLNTDGIRATYGAVGKVIGVIPRGVGKYLGDRRAEASWVVRKKDGHPTGYNRDDKHEKLYSNTRIIQTGAELDELLQKHSE